MKVLWTDGSASPNPGPGGYAVVENGQPVCLGAENPSTNIRMEGTALIEAIRYAGAEPSQIHTDSEFWVKTLTQWAPQWEARGWQKSRGEIANLEMVQELYDLYNTRDVELIWVRGHAGTADNEAADHWAGQARDGLTMKKYKEMQA